MFTVIEVPPFRPSDKGMSEMSQVTVVKRTLTLDNLKRKMTSEWFYDSTFYTIPIEMHVQGNNSKTLMSPGITSIPIRLEKKPSLRQKILPKLLSRDNFS